MACRHNINNPERMHVCFLCVSESASQGANEKPHQAQERRKKYIAQLQARKEDIDAEILKLQAVCNDYEMVSEATAHISSTIADDVYGNAGSRKANDNLLMP